MGNLISKLFFNEETRLMMIGLDNSGKTSILYRLKMGEEVDTIPTIGVNTEDITIEHKNFRIFDLGGQYKIRPLWRHYYEEVDGIIFVIDSSDKERLDECSHTLKKISNSVSLKNSSFLILANKNDVENHMNKEELIEILNLNSMKQTFHIEMCSAKTNNGIKEGLIWLSENISK